MPFLARPYGRVRYATARDHIFLRVYALLLFLKKRYFDSISINQNFYFRSDLATNQYKKNEIYTYIV
jgi:hypothetical protein